MASAMKLRLRNPGHRTSSFMYWHEMAKEEDRKSGPISLEF